MADPGEAAGGPPPPLYLDQTEARRAEKMFFGDRAPPPLLKGLDYRPPSPFERRTSSRSEPFFLF